MNFLSAPRELWALGHCVGIAERMLPRSVAQNGRGIGNEFGHLEGRFHYRDRRDRDITWAQLGGYVRILATWAFTSPSGWDSSCGSLWCSWEDSSSSTQNSESCFHRRACATWAEGRQARRFPTNVRRRRSTGTLVRPSNRRTKEAGACQQMGKTQKQCRLQIKNSWIYSCLIKILLFHWIMLEDIYGTCQHFIEAVH